MAQATLGRGTRSPRLSDEEIHALACVATGMTLDTAARHLGISDRTVRRRIRAACDRLHVNTPIEAVVWAARHNLL